MKVTAGAVHSVKWCFMIRTFLEFVVEKHPWRGQKIMGDVQTFIIYALLHGEHDRIVFGTFGIAQKILKIYLCQFFVQNATFYRGDAADATYFGQK